MKNITLSTLLIIGAATGCADQGKGPEDDAPAADGKDDSFAKPTDHGAIAFAAAQKASFTGSAEYHTWEFTLSGAATIHAFTSRVPHYATPDTVLYLYKKTASGTWGSYIARNDDASGSTTLSVLDRALAAGDYRVLVKGYDSSTRGQFGIEVDCTGAGCTPTPPPPPAGCVFGTFADDFNNDVDPDLLHNRHPYAGYAAFAADMRPAVIGQDIIAAMIDTGWTDVTTVEEAFSHADQEQITVDYVYDLVGARAFVAIEYGSGDNPYGAIFADVTGAKIAGLHDSDVTSCTVDHATCELHQNFGDLQADAAWVKVSEKTITSASQLSGAQAADALTAIQVAYTDATTLAGGIAETSDHAVRIMTLKNGATTVETYDYSAGDNPYGAIFTAGTTTLAAEIHDGDFYRCSLLQ